MLMDTIALRELVSPISTLVQQVPFLTISILQQLLSVNLVQSATPAIRVLIL